MEGLGLDELVLKCVEICDRIGLENFVSSFVSCDLQSCYAM